MSSESIAAPVALTRTATVTRAGTYCRGRLRSSGGDGDVMLRPGDEVACRPLGGGWRHGLARVAADGSIDFEWIASIADGDVLYRVEPLESRIDDLARQIAASGASAFALPVGQSFALTGGWRVYFNRRGAADRPWCVAPNTGGWEVAVRSVSIATISETVYTPKTTPDSEDGKPSAWIAVDGYLTVHLSGHATIGAP